MQFSNTLEFAQRADAEDKLKEFRNEFIIPVVDGKEHIYFLGNSLGLQPRTTEAALKKVLQQWATHGVESFFVGDEPWLQFHDTLTGPLANIVGAKAEEIVVMNQLTVNLHLMMVSFYRPAGKRNRILCEAKAFPSDQYMFETHIKHLGLDPAEVLIELAPRSGEHTIRTEDIIATIEANRDELALVLWGGLNYYSGQVFDMKAIAAAAKRAGVKIGFDLAHAVGNVPLQLHDWDVDFACWCSYKYLNSGPGAIGGAYVHERYHNDPSIHRFAGWWGYEKNTRFKMEKGFVPIATAEGWQLSTPSILLYAAHKASLDIFERAGMERLHKKRSIFNGYLWFVLDEINASQSRKLIEFITPRGENERGCQVSMLMLERGREIYKGLMEEGIITDWREPNVIRLAPVPLYNTFEEVWKFGDALRRQLE
jgi:kynureninase